METVSKEEKRINLNNQAVELVEKFCRKIGTYNNDLVINTAKRCAILHCELMIAELDNDGVMDTELGAFKVAKIFELKALIQAIKTL